MKVKIVSASLMILLVGSMSSRVIAKESNAFQDISVYYEAIRLSLLNDSLTDIAEHAKAIENRVEEITKNFDAEDSGVPAEKSAEIEVLYPEISSAAASLAEAEDLNQAREALFELSKPMGRYRKLAGIEGSMVVFCPMAKKAWLQPHGDIGNPYLGEKRATCGEVIAD